MAKHKLRDYFAEMYVAGMFADEGWNVYFPHRDEGFDFIVTLPHGDEILVRPVQVKGKYSTALKTDKDYYGFSGELSVVHEEMILAIPFFTTSSEKAPVITAFLPMPCIRPNQNNPGEYRALPASFEDGVPVKRRDYTRFFDKAGLNLAASKSWGKEKPRSD